MKRRTYIYLIVVIACLIYSISGYFIAMHQSYDKYLDGEYFFRYKASTVDTRKTDNWWTTESQSEDLSDPKTLLLRTSGTSVYAVDPHDGVCTVYYAGSIVEDFPVANLAFENDDAGYFYGSKKYTFEEYIDEVREANKTHDADLRISDKHMSDFEKLKPFMFILIAVDAILAAVLFFLYRSESYTAFNRFMFIGAVLGIAFEVVAFVMLR